MHQPLHLVTSPRRSRRERFGAHAWSDAARRDLERELREALLGEIRFDGASRAMYSTAGSNYRQVPIGVVIPRSVEDIVAALRICNEHGAPVLTRGGGTSLAGQCCNVAVLIDCSKYVNRIISIDAARRRAVVQPGLILDHLRKAAEEHHLTFAPDPSTHNHCTLGGMIGNNSCGVHSLMAGKTDENVDSLDILLYDGTRMCVGTTSDEEFARIVQVGGRTGEIYSALRQLRDRYADAIRREFPRIPRRVSGYNLPWLLPENGFDVAKALVGSEGTCVTVLQATVRLVPSPQFRTLVALGYADVYTAADDVPRVLEFKPIGLEGMDDRLVGDIRHIGVREDSLKQLPAGKGWLLVEFGGDSREEADAKAREMVARLQSTREGLTHTIGSTHPIRPTHRIFDDKEHEEQIWRTREAGLGATAHVTSEHPTWEGWEDSAIPPERLGDYLRALRKLLDRYQYIGDFYGHFGQGCLHTRINFDLFTADGIKTFRSFIGEASDLVVSLGGSLSGEHGDGQSKAEMLPRMFGPDIMEAFREFKRIWDPAGLMNPGKIVDPFRVDENLRYGSDYNHPNPPTEFRFPDAGGSLARTMQKCVGVGECRRTDSGTMCPSFQVTREEKHSTRGRAHLLWEMLEGDPLEGGWHSEDVKEALDLCLACKGCKGDCPVHVDMATYKAEFLSHYYGRHFRPRTAWAFGLIHWWARVGALMPSLVNWVTHAPGLSTVARMVAGMPLERDVPAFATWTFRDWMTRRKVAGTVPRKVPGTSVVLWPDTFNDHFHPETARAATELLESAGFDVRIPSRRVCCGRPLYDYGLLTLARRLLLDVLDAIRDEIRAGLPVIVLEPSCAAVFRDELVNMLPNDRDAERLSKQVVLLGDFVQAHRDRFDLPRVNTHVLFHGHCHQKAVFDQRPDIELLKSLGAEVDAPDTGCCGMAGSFGFEAAHYDVSKAVGERVLLPAVRTAAQDTVIVSDGFSCREQIHQATGRDGLHLAEVLRLAQHGALAGERPERNVRIDFAAQAPARIAAFAAAAMVLMGCGSALYGLTRR